MTSAEYAAWQVAHAQGECERSRQVPLIPTDAEREELLHDMIIAWTRRQDPQVAYIHSRMDKRSTATPGAPDFVLLLAGGKTLLVECKTKSGTLSPDQERFAAAASLNGHAVHVVRDYPAFLALVKAL